MSIDLSTKIEQPADLSVAAVDARAMARYAGLTGRAREETIDYMQGIGFGRWGTTSQAGRDYAHRVLDVMTATKEA